MTARLRVTLVQHAASLVPEENRAALSTLTPESSDLVVFPEAFARDFGQPGSDISEFAEDLDGPFAAGVAKVAEDRGTTLVAGMFERSDDAARPWNTLVMRGVAESTYRKIHLYDSFGYRESDRLTAGPLTASVVGLAGFRIGLMTCYDLRFPELGRALVDAGAEVLVVPAAWVAGPRKIDHWRTLARARAIENVAYVVAAGQPGPRYSGHSLVVDPWGEILSEADEGPAMLTVDLHRDQLTEARSTNPSLANRRM